MLDSEEYTNTVTSYGKLKWASGERRTIFTVVLFIFPVLTSGFKVQCPTTMHRSYRSKSLCNDTDHSYYCLFDINTGGYRENCLIFPATDTKGFRKVFAENLDGIECAPETYQPFKYWTNESSDCVYQKSLCDSEGQIVHDDGNNEVDQQCRCDYRLGYGYVFKPKDGCKCVPSQEDCSCYKIFCPKGKLLTPDYECRSTDNWKTKFNCPEISIGPVITEPPIELIKDTSKESGLKASSKYTVTGAVVLTGLILVIGAMIVLTASTWDKNETVGLQYVYISALQEDIPQNIIELQQYEVGKWKQQLLTFVPTSASNAVLDSMNKNQFAMITGSFGCGKTVTAYYVALKLVESEGYDLLLVSDPNDIIRYSKANGKQLLFIDDIFGKHTIDEHNKDWWDKQHKRIQSIVSRNKDLKILATSRSYVFNRIDHRGQLPFCEISFLSDDTCVNINERRKIGNKYIGDDIDGFGDEILGAFDFFPALCSRISVEDGFNELLDPCKYLTSEIDLLYMRLDVTCLLFSLMVIMGNAIKIEMFCNPNHENDKKLLFLSDEIGFSVVPSKKLLFKSLVSLKESFFVDENNIYSFKNEKLFEVFALCVSKHVIKSLLRYGKLSVLKDRFVLESFSKHRDLSKSVLVPKCFECIYFDRMLMDIKTGLFWDVFLDTNNNILEFRNMFIDYLRGHFTWKDIKEDKNKSTVLHVVADQGYHDYVEYFFDLDRSRINVADKHGKTPLHLASKKGHTMVVEKLIKRKAFFDITDNEGNTPLHLACAGGHVDSVNELLSNRAAIKQNPSTLVTALHLVCKNGHKELAEILMKRNASVNVSDKNFYTPLHCASMKNNVEICRLLLSRDANVNSVDAKGRTPLFHACEKNNLEVVNLLIGEKANPSLHEKELSQTPLHIACEKGNKDVAEKLLTSNVNVNAVDVHGNTPLYLASKNGYDKIVDALLLKNANPNTLNDALNLPIHAATLNGHADVVDSLIDFKSDINRKNKDDQTPLHIACDKKHANIVKILLEHEACVTEKDKNKLTPMHIACLQGNIPIVELICASLKPNDCNEQDKYGRSPLFIACENGHTKLVEIILKEKADANTKNKDGLPLLHTGCREGFVDIVELLLDHNANVNSTDSDLWTPLLVACKEQNLKISEILLKARADVNQANKDGDTPLHEASATGNELITNLLVSNGANVNHKNKLGETPLWKCSTNGHITVARYLVQHGADTDITDRFGTALEIHIRRMRNGNDFIALLSAHEMESAL